MKVRVKWWSDDLGAFEINGPLLGTVTDVPRSLLRKYKRARIEYTKVCHEMWRHFNKLGVRP